MHRIRTIQQHALSQAAALAVLILPFVTTAQGLQNPLRFGTLSEFLNAVLNAVILIAFPVLVLFLVYAGFLFISAQGNDQKLSQARTVFLWTLIGALLILGSKALAIAINSTVQQITP